MKTHYSNRHVRFLMRFTHEQLKYLAREMIEKYPKSPKPDLRIRLSIADYLKDLIEVNLLSYRLIYKLIQQKPCMNGHLQETSLPLFGLGTKFTTPK